MRISVICGSRAWAKNEPFVLEAADPKVDQQPLREARGLQVVDNLGVLPGRQPPERLDLDNHSSVIDELRTINAVQPDEREPG